jgi:NAD(P)-dependent dehydrogenase (short-subunit alcohol dehydrogenase family)
VVVTGAAGSIGSAISARLAADGWAVLCLDIAADGLARVVDEISAAGGTVRGEVCDVTDRAQIDAAVAAGETLGPLCGLVNNAMRWSSSGDLCDMSEQAWDEDMRILLGSYRSMASAVAGRLGPGGAIVQISSVHGLLASPGWGPYDVAKAAIIQLTRCLAGELGPRGVRVNAIAPGIITRDDQVHVYDEDPAIRREHELIAPLRRWGNPRDVAGVVAFLLGPDSGFVTGQTLAVDGGMTSVLQLSAVQLQLDR